MGKKRHSKDKLYLVASEYARDWGGYKGNDIANSAVAIGNKALPFDRCALTLLPFKDAVCTREGVVFDAEALAKYSKHYGRNPATGKPLAPQDLIPLKFHCNQSGAFHCPITYKEFTSSSHIVANALSGHVYSHEAVEMLCKRNQSWTDLITGEPFAASDLITIQKPHHCTVPSLAELERSRKELWTDLSLKRTRPDASARLEFPVSTEASSMSENVETSMENYVDSGHMDKKLKNGEAATTDILMRHRRIMSGGAAATDSSTATSLPAGCRSDAVGAFMSSTPVAGTPSSETLQSRAHMLYTTHRQTASFTSTAVSVAANAEFRQMTAQELREEMYNTLKSQKAKAYVQVRTTLGALNFELYCDKVPRACDNFLQLCSNGYYDDTIFHRSISNFMIQGGDPTGTGKGGSSAFGDPFKDEFHPSLRHRGAGVLSMANSGRHSNTSQFFVTYKSCPHLDDKHVVFGKLVGGMETLKKMEKLPTRKKDDRPLDPPRILGCKVFQDPFREFREASQQKSRNGS